MNTENLIKSLNQTIQKEFPDLKGIYFIGSRMKGTSTHYYSDYDFVFTLGHKPHWREKKRIRAILCDFELMQDIVIDGKIYEDKELKNIWTPFRETVLNEGVFYEAPQ